MLRFVATIVAGLLLPFVAHAAITTNFSDQWWNPNESGWGVAVLQQRDVLFIDVFVYGADGRPTWFTAAANLTGGNYPSHFVFTGDLYATSGPYFASGIFDPKQTTSRRVGTLTFDADSADTATLTYSVDGLVVNKLLTRQLWTYENFTGFYYGGLVYDITGCVPPQNNIHFEEFGAVAISQPTDTTFSMTTQSITSCHWDGAYSQLGHMGTVRGMFGCDNGVLGTFTLSELEHSLNGITGRVTASYAGASACQLFGRLGGVRR